MADVYRNYEAKCKKIREENAKLLSEFGKWISHKGLSEKTIREHVSNADFYVNEFLLYEDAIKAADGPYHVGMFLGYWFIKKALWASESSIRSNAASLKKFYDFMHEQGLVSEEAVRDMRARIREGMPEWLARRRR